MNALEAAQRIGAVLDDDQLPYAVGGALALGVWGVYPIPPRQET